MGEKFYIELYQKEGEKFRLLTKKDADSLEGAKSEILAFVEAGYDEKNIVCYIVKELPFVIQRSVSFGEK